MSPSLSPLSAPLSLSPLSLKVRRAPFSIVATAFSFVLKSAIHLMKMKEKKELGKISPTEVQKRCSICHTTTTPLWRVGPAGPKSLCNACGIKYTKRRRNFLGLNRGKTEKGKNRKNRAHGGDDVAKPTPALKKLKLIAEMRSKKLGEEERAAILLMALSCGSFYA